MRTMRWWLLGAAVVLVWLVAGLSLPVPAAASDYGSEPEAGAGGGWSTISAQDGVLGQDVAAEDDTRLSVQLWTVFAAAGAAGVGLLAFLLRLVMGWVKPPPPPQEEGPH